MELLPGRQPISSNQLLKELINAALIHVTAEGSGDIVFFIVQADVIIVCERSKSVQRTDLVAAATRDEVFDIESAVDIIQKVLQINAAIATLGADAMCCGYVRPLWGPLATSPSRKLLRLSWLALWRLV